ncbi:MAG: transposase, partial [Desulfovibrionaceae bacterium]
KQHVHNKRIRTMPRKARLMTSPVFGILEQCGWAFADLMPGFQSDTIFHFHLNFHLPLAKSGNIVYSGRYRHYATLVTCVDSHSLFPVARGSEKPAVMEDEFFFWSWARRRLKRYKGVTSCRFPLYLKEMEFRYNHRDQDILPLVLERVCSLVPELD